jgi:hypothetical protein
MFKKNLLMAFGFVTAIFLLYKICAFIGLPLYPYGLLLFILPLLGLIPLFQYLSFKELNGYKQYLISQGLFTPDQLETMTHEDIERSWRESLNRAYDDSSHPSNPSKMS